MAREPAVAGQFYPGDPSELESMIERFTPGDQEKTPALGALSPHAGYVFCGGVMGRLFGGMDIPETVLLLNPSHKVGRPAVALWTGEPWETPLGEVELDEGLCGELSDLPMVTEDKRPHAGEHSGEVVLPFLQYHQPDLEIAVACVTGAAELDELLELGDAVAGMTEEREDLLVVASSDMSHESGPDALDIVKKQDPKAIEKMKGLDPEGLLQVCRRENITMCGVLPAVAMMQSAKVRGAAEGTMVERATSADSPYGSAGYVVGYAGMRFDRPGAGGG